MTDKYLDVTLNAEILDRGETGFRVRRYRPTGNENRTLIVLDDELIGDAAISATRARCIDGSLSDIELILVGFGTNRFAPLHQARGRSLTMHQVDLSVVGMQTTGEGAALAKFILGEVAPCAEGRIGLLGYSLSALFAIDLFARLPSHCKHLALLSPSMWVDDNCESRLSSALAQKPEAHLFMAVGDMETTVTPGSELTMCEEIVAAGGRLNSLHGGRATCTVFPQTDHSSIILHAMDSAIRSFC